MPRKAKPGKKFKLKTHKATSKRFRLTGSGVLVRTKGGKSHLRRRTSDRTKATIERDDRCAGSQVREAHQAPRPQHGLIVR
jgi:ribosomal protein L35